MSNPSKPSLSSLERPSLRKPHYTTRACWKWKGKTTYLRQPEENNWIIRLVGNSSTESSNAWDDNRERRVGMRDQASWKFWKNAEKGSHQMILTRNTRVGLRYSLTCETLTHTVIIPQAACVDSWFLQWFRSSVGSQIDSQNLLKIYLFLQWFAWLKLNRHIWATRF